MAVRWDFAPLDHSPSSRKTEVFKISRQQRRAAERQGQPAFSAAPQAAGLFAAAMAAQQAGRPAEAEQLYRQILQVDPRHVDSLNMLALLVLRQERAAEAVALINKALTVAPRIPASHLNIAFAYQILGQLNDAARHATQAIKLQPNNPAAHHGLGRVMQAQGRLQEAASAYKKALSLAADPRVLCNLGNVQIDQGALEGAEISFEKARALAPHLAEPLNGLGVVHLRRGQPQHAASVLQRAVALRPDFGEALNNYARACLECGQAPLAIDQVCRSLAAADTPETRGLFVTCVAAAGDADLPETLSAPLERAIDERWGRPGDLAQIGARIVAARMPLAVCITRAEQAWPGRLDEAALFGGHAALIAGDTLLRSVISVAPVCDRGLERFLTNARAILLETAHAMDGDERLDDAALGFWCALAQQCFVNEHAFACLPGEAERAEALFGAIAAALDSGAAIPPLWPVAVTAYLPLARLPAPARLLGRRWPDQVAALLVQHVEEPIEERRLREGISRLTAVSDGVSRSVQAHYEDNPYPRWVAAGRPGPPATIQAHLARQFPQSKILIATQDHPEILVVGCGTGQQPIEVARMYKDARVLAVDLSLTSLAYAARQTAKLGVGGIEYAQADLLQLGSLGRRFDMIQANGVLHHLADPLQGWRVLLEMLRPGGVMYIGLYSERARRDVVAARRLIAGQGLQPHPDDMRRCRQMMLDADDDTPLRRLSRSPDFGSLSGCRDLLFHVQEHWFSLPEIKAFLAANQLRFLGFDLDPGIAHRYQSRFPDDPLMTDLDCWDQFEVEHPELFAGMYSLWIQKDRSDGGLSGVPI
jgi:Tfp pilus assembly protein PilF/SAM-dependent methyltransferase